MFSSFLWKLVIEQTTISNVLGQISPISPISDAYIQDPHPIASVQQSAKDAKERFEAAMSYVKAEMESEDDLVYVISMTHKGNAGRSIYFKGPLAARFKGEKHTVFVFAITSRAQIQAAIDKGMFDLKEGDAPLLLLE